MAALVVAVIIGANIGTPQMAMATTASTAQSDRSFESEEYGFRLQIPQGWVIEELEEPLTDPLSSGDDSEVVAVLCLENEALPGIGGEYNCQAGALTDRIGIARWPDLQSMPEFEDVAASNITTNDLLALLIQETENQTRNMRIENNTDVNEFVKLVDLSYAYYDNAGTLFNPLDDATYETSSRQMFVLSQDRDTGYNIYNDILANNTTANRTETQHSPAVQEVFDSFELVGQG